MPHYEVLAADCKPRPDCAKVARSATGMIAIVGDPITDPAELAALGVAPGEGALRITEALYRAGHENL